MNKHENLIIAILGLLYAVLVMAWPDADFSKTQFVETGLYIILAALAATNIKGFGVALATRYDFRREVNNAVRLLRAKGIDVSPELAYLAGELASAGDKLLENEAARAVKGG